MQRVHKSGLARGVVVASVLFLVCCVPGLHNYANAQRSAPGFGSEMLVPFLPLIVVLLRNCVGDYIRAVRGEEGDIDKQLIACRKRPCLKATEWR